MKHKTRHPFALVWLACCVLMFTQGLEAQTEPIVGLHLNTPRVHALINARIVPSPGKVIDKGVVILRDGIIEAVGEKVTPPADARIWDCEGLTIYPGLIEMYSSVGVGDTKPDDSGTRHWNAGVRSEMDVVDFYKPSSQDLGKLRALGFTAALIVPHGGIFRGQSALMSLADGSTNERVIRKAIAQHLAFERIRGSYPGSLMGVIALMRQTFLDAKWYHDAHEALALKPEGQERPENNVSLHMLKPAIEGEQPVMFETGNALAILRSMRVAKEFGLRMWLRGNGQEYRFLEALKASQLPIVLPVNFPDAPVVEDPEDALRVTLSSLQHWDIAPENPGRLENAGISFALTSSQLKKPADFHKQVHKAIQRGLSADRALAVLTTTPARLLGVSRQLGTVAPGKLGHLLITDGDLFESDTKVIAVWVDGDRYEVKVPPKVDPRGKWQLTMALVDTVRATLDLKGEVAKLSGTLAVDSTKIKLSNVMLVHRRLAVSFDGDSLGYKGRVRLSGGLEGRRLSGYGELPDGTAFDWHATFDKAPGKKKAKKTPVVKNTTTPLVYPPGAYGRLNPPEQPAWVLVRGAKIWTCGPDGLLDNADLLIKRGKIEKIGQGIEAPRGAVVIDANGKHVTPGIVDAHSHTAMSGGGNEGSQAVTAEVRVGDIVNSTDIGMYRQLAGGVTTINILHGSANPIGGQNAVIKLRWGLLPEQLKLVEAIPGIKLALGENVKRSNSRTPSTRYPQSRMGVEQLIRDRFQAAKDYDVAWQTYRGLRNKNGVVPPRRDLELEALLEILQGKRQIHAHSYRQDEILMLVRVADDFGFKIAAFQHVLEGYKVAEALAQQGAGASTFSDWWAYKFEVFDAIPHNGALMHDAGVLVSFNSDSAELARRLNADAAKAVKYGGVSETEALKFVTLNPAKQLGIDQLVGSLEVGKDADFAIWNGDPLSVYTICEETWIEGRKYFDREDDLKMQGDVKAERARLIQKVLADGKKGGEK